ncbi:MAG: Vacuolar protein sorting-associated protein 41 [Sclerophora amabilis]|nr:MAG: Vacuolar protein sorting-associated protein 41 [Sclerophora amabilis]
MAAEPDEKDDENNQQMNTYGRETSNGRETSEGEDEDDTDDDDEEDDEPILKYAKLTGSLGRVYRNGDATSAFLVAGDKMPNGDVAIDGSEQHVLSLPSFQPVRVYHAHSASVTAISISPFSPPPGNGKSDAANRLTQSSQASPRGTTADATVSSSPQKGLKEQPVPLTRSNSIHIATSSIDGNVCVASLVDQKYVMLRNFARPVQSVALSPTFKTNRTYLSGGLAGKLILTVGGRSGASSASSTSGSAAETGSGWLSSIGLSTNSAKDTVLHSGEGAISTIKWSLTGKYVVWINENGIKIMRSNHLLESTDSEFAWKRISHIDHPSGSGWDEMSSVWKGRAEWIDEDSLMSEENASLDPRTAVNDARATNNDSNARSTALKADKTQSLEKLVVGWGGTVWIIHVHPGGTGVGKNVGERSVGRAEIVTILRNDCIISGLSLYTPNLLLLLAYTTPDEDEDETDSFGDSKSRSKGKRASISTADTTPKRGFHHRKNALAPELRLINLTTSEEASADSLSVSRFGGLSATDYLLGVLPPTQASKDAVASRGSFDVFGGSLWTAGWTATNIFGSAASIRSSDSQSDATASAKGTGTASIKEGSMGHLAGSSNKSINPAAAATGIKIFIHSPYDCVLATKRDLADHLGWLLGHEKYAECWELIDQHPRIISTGSTEMLSDTSPSTPAKKGSSVDEFFADDMSVTNVPAKDAKNSAAEKEKRRIGELWVEQLLKREDWVTAGEVCGKVVDTSSRWEHWIWVFVEADKFDEITPFVPTTQLRPPLPSLTYEVLLAHYIAHDRLRLKELLDRWAPELFDVEPVTVALEDNLRSGDVSEDSIEDGEIGRDWRILSEGLAKLFFAQGQYRKALKQYIKLQDADEAMNLIRDYHLLDAVADDIPGLVKLRVSKQQLERASRAELESATSEAIGLLVHEAHHGIVRPEVVVRSLEESDHDLFLFFYLRSLWTGHSTLSEPTTEAGRVNEDRALTSESGRSVVEFFSDLAVSLFAEYDRGLLFEFLKSSESYTLETASTICERRTYVPESVYLLSKTGQTKRALFLIIDQLDDVSQAIAFAKSQDDPDLWNDLLVYSMNKPRFILGLLQEVGTAIDPIELVRRIPKGLEIEGLRDGLSRLIREHEIQFSISEGVARVLRGEVAEGMDTLRMGQRRGVKFDVLSEASSPLKVKVAPAEDEKELMKTKTKTKTNEEPHDTEEQGLTNLKPSPGHCVVCGQAFSEDEKETLIGFACGHVFHLSSCLAPTIAATSSDPLADLSVLEDDADAETNAATGTATAIGTTTGSSSATYSSRTVGTKVTHARIIRDRIAGGCPVCAAAAGAGVGVGVRAGAGVQEGDYYVGGS